MQQTRPTVLDVARRAGVSVGTVSNVLNGTSRVSEARRKRVLEAITDLGYTQNLLAQGLRKHRSTMVGLCVPHTSVAYFAALVSAFEELASARGYEIMQVLSHQDPKREKERIEALLRYKIGGLILVPSMEPEAALDVIVRSGTPLVVVDRPTLDPRFDEVTFDNRRAMYDATRRLIAHGHRRILFIVRQKGLIVTRQRVEGMTAAARECRERVTTEIFECGYDDVGMIGHLASAFRKARPPTAIIVSNSAFAAWAIRAIRALRLDYPDKLSLLAFDEPEWADLVTPRLSVVRQPTQAIARRAWEFLIRRMSGEPVGVQREEFVAEVVIRDSVAPAA